MSNFSDSFWRRAGRNTADRVSNAIFGDNWARPYKRVTDEARADAIRQRAEAAQAKADAIANIHYTRAAIEEKNQLNAIDAAVLQNVDKVIAMPFAEDTGELVQQLNGLVIQLSTNSFSKKTEEERVRAKYTEAVFQKLKQGVELLLVKDPYHPNTKYIYNSYLNAQKQRRKDLRNKLLLIIWSSIGFLLFIGFCLAMDGNPRLLLTSIMIAVIALSIWIDIAIVKAIINKRKLSKARKVYDATNAYRQRQAPSYSAPTHTEQQTQPTPSRPSTQPAFNQKHSYDHLWNKYSHLSPLMQNGYRTCQLTGHKDILIVGLYYPYMQIKQGNTIYPINQYEWKMTLDFILKNSEEDLTNRTSYLDLFPIQSEPFKIMDEIIRNPKMFDYVIEQISLDQTIIEDIVRPKLIIVTDNDAAAFFGKLPEYIWMGYKFQLIEKTPRGELYRIVGFRPEERIQPNRTLTNLIGTKVYFTVNDIPSAYETNLWLNS